MASAAKALVTAARKAAVSIEEELKKAKIEHSKDSSGESKNSTPTSPQKGQVSCSVSSNSLNSSKDEKTSEDIECKTDRKAIKKEQLQKWVTSIRLLLHVSKISC